MIHEYDKNPEDIISGLQAKVAQGEKALADEHQKLVETLDSIEPIRQALTQQEADNTELGQQLLQANTDRDAAVRSQKIAEEKVAGLEGAILTLQGEKSACENDLASLQVEALQALSLWRLVKEAMKRIFHLS